MAVLLKTKEKINIIHWDTNNFETDRGVTYRMPTPLANRFVHLEFALDFDSWKVWAYKANIDSR